MAKVAVKLYAALKDRAGAGRLDVEGQTVGDVLRALARSARPELTGALFEPDGAVKSGFQICLNTNYLDPRKLDSTAVKDGDTVHLMPPIAGGAGDKAPDSKWGFAPRPTRGRCRAASAPPLDPEGPDLKPSESRGWKPPRAGSPLVRCGAKLHFNA